MRSFFSPSTDPAFNLALEETLFDSLSPENPEFFLLWQNAPSIIIGRHQNTAEEINSRYCHEHGINIVRRESGGGAVYHDLGNVNFSFLSWTPDKRLQGVEKYTLLMLAVLSDLGISAEFSSRNDISVHGKKVCGTAQRRTGQKMLHHGCLLVDADTTILSEALAVDADKFKSKGISSHKARVANLIDFLPGHMSREDAVTMVISTTMKRCCSVRCILDPRTLQSANELAEAKYRKWDWNWGKSPDYTECKRHRFSWGKIEMRLNVSHGIIHGCKFYGDFFALKNIEELEALLLGKKTSFEELEAALHEIPLETWFLNANRRELLEFICGVSGR